MQPPISVLKPLCGHDDNLYENLASLARQTYPCFELLFGVADVDDTAIPVVRRLQRAYPQVPMRLVLASARVARNPKVNTLMYLMPLAAHEHLVISDSNVLVGEDYLSRLAADISAPGVGMVSNLIVGTGERTLGASLENLHLNTFVSAMASAADCVGSPLVIGKSMMMRRADLLRAGGLSSVADVLAEDYVLGQRFHGLGHRVVLSGCSVRTVNQKRSIRSFLSRHLRWAQLRRWGTPWHFAAEPLAYPVPLLLVGAVLCVASDAPSAVVPVAISGVVLKLMSDTRLVMHLRGQRPPLAVVLLSPLKDVALLGVWFVAAFARTVVWRGNRLRIGPGTRLSALDSEAPDSSPWPDGEVGDVVRWA